MEYLKLKYDLRHGMSHAAVLVLMGLILSVSLVACGGKDDDSDTSPDDTSARITGIYLPKSITVTDNATFTVKGTGYAMTDAVGFTAADSKEYKAATVSVSATYIELRLPEDMPAGKYNVSVTRADGRVQSMGETVIERVHTFDVPDKAGMNVKGMVVCDGKGLADVVVSDGYNVITTDADGRFWMNSDKKEKMVFISVPSGYMPASKKGIPQFFARLKSGTDKTEQVLFELNEEPNDNHVVLAMADAHLANRSSKDVSQFQAGFVPDVNALIASYKSQGKNVYGITLGDQSWDLYWYDNNFGIKEAVAEFAKVNCPVFHCMGNHDNDIKAKGDWACAQQWRDNVGPTYYSFNLGKVHYVILDDIDYFNTTNDREQASRIVADQMAWLRKDLATVKDKSAPLVLCMHVPLHHHATVNSAGQQVDNPTQIENASELIAAVGDFTDVKLLTGHTHINFDGKVGSNIHEYNIGGVCATWWWTGAPGYHNNHICREGSPGGYGVFEWTGASYSHYYKGIGHDRSYQMRTYDLNNVLITKEVHCPKANDDMAALISVYAMGYDKVNNNNEVLINVFNFGHDWKIEVAENGRKLDVTRINGYDPLHIVSFEMARLGQNKHNFSSSSMRSCRTAHLFKVKASSAASPLDITVTDEHGNVYTESMTRPKNFTYSMK